MEQIAGWVAPIATTIAALMTASNLGSRITGFGFIVFTVGSIAWFALGLATHQSNLVWQNVILTATNLFGVWRWLGRQSRLEEGARAAAQASAAAPVETMFPVSLLGRGRIVGSDGEELGSAVDAMAGCDSGRLAYVVVAAGGLAGVGEKLYRLDWRDARVDGERIHTPLGRAAFESLPELPKDEWPVR